MASRKNLKKSVKSVCDDLFADCVVLSMVEQGDREELNKLMGEVAALYGDIVCRISHVEPGLAPREYFKKVRNDFTERANSLSDRIMKA